MARPTLSAQDASRCLAMWSLRNQTAYSAERTWVRDKAGRHFWVVAVKATFDITPEGKLRLADQQPPPAQAPEYHGEPGRSSLRWDSDLLHVKPCTDVIAEAHAHAPGGRAHQSVSVSLRVGPIRKALQVYGNRVYYKRISDLVTSAPVPFVSRPITYEWSFGGVDLTDPDPRNHRVYLANPIGKGFALDRTRLERQAAPAIEAPGQDVATSGPAGFGALDASWSPRRELAGTYDEAWSRTKRPLLPDDYSELFASSAPADQRAPQYLRGGEPVELLGMTASGALRFTLPTIHLAFTTYFGRRREEHRGHLATVLLLPEAAQVALVWQTSLFVPPRETDYLDYTTVLERPGLA